MKRDELKKIEGLTDDQIQKILDIHQVDCEKWKSEKADLQSKVDEAAQKVKDFEGVDVADLKKQISDWQTKYTDDMAAKDKEYAKKILFGGYKFKSKLAEKAAMLEFDEKGLAFENGKFLGADDFFKGLKESDPNAFETESGSEPQAPKTTGLDVGGGKPKTLSGVEASFYALNPDLKPKGE